MFFFSVFDDFFFVVAVVNSLLLTLNFQCSSCAFEEFFFFISCDLTKALFDVALSMIDFGVVLISLFDKYRNATVTQNFPTNVINFLK